MWWAGRSLAGIRRTLRYSGLPEVAVPSPPALPPEAVRGVRYVLRRRAATCLQRALVLQAWHAAHGAPREIVIGVAGGSEAFAAHAWLEGDPGDPGRGFDELMRLPAR